MTKAKDFARIQINVSPNLHKKVKEFVADHEMSISQWIRILLEEKVGGEYFDEREEERHPPKNLG